MAIMQPDAESPITFAHVCRYGHMWNNANVPSSPPPTYTANQTRSTMSTTRSGIRQSHQSHPQPLTPTISANTSSTDDDSPIPLPTGTYTIVNVGNGYNAAILDPNNQSQVIASPGDKLEQDTGIEWIITNHNNVSWTIQNAIHKTFAGSEPSPLHGDFVECHDDYKSYEWKIRGHSNYEYIIGIGPICWSMEEGAGFRSPVKLIKYFNNPLNRWKIFLDGNPKHNQRIDGVTRKPVTDEKVYQWLKAAAPNAIYDAARKAHTKGTGAWFTGSQRFVVWMKEQNSYLWVHGKSGSGKTVLSATVVSEISSHFESMPSVARAYFFFDGRGGQRYPQTYDYFLRSLIRQLAGQCEAFPSSLSTLYMHCFKMGTEPLIENLENTLLQILRSFDDIYIVVDALDECDDRKDTLDWIQGMASEMTISLHLLVTSRNEEDIAEALRPLDPDHVEMKSDTNLRDIEMYLDHTFQRDSIFNRWKNEKADIKQRLLKSADGMFRLVSLQVQELRHCYTRKDLEEQLDSFPTDIFGFYDRITSTIKGRDRIYACRILQWLAFSARPLELREIAQVIGVVSDPQQGFAFDPDSPCDARDIFRICSSLITQEDDIVRLAHMSVKDYLVRHDQHGISTFKIGEKTSNTFISQTCLAYLLQFKTYSMLTENTIQDFPLVSYAAEYWLQHHELGSDEWGELEQRLLFAFFQPHATPPFVAWVRLHNIDDPQQGQNLHLSPEAIPPPLYYASLCCFSDVVAHLLEHGANANAPGGQYGNPLQAAIYQYCKTVITLLLRHGADVHAQGGMYGNALQAVLHCGNEDMLHLILEKEPDINAQGGFYGSPLQAAACVGDEMAVQLLLHRGANPNAKGGYHGNALEAAASLPLEDMDIVRLLVDHGADVNAKGGPFGTALQAAALHGSQLVVELLLERGADVSAKGGYYGYALQAASLAGFEGIVELLLDKQADVNAQGGWYGNALQAASYAGNESIVKLLLEHGAIVNALGGYHGHALQAAAYGGGDPIVGLLLDNGADIDAKGGSGPSSYAFEVVLFEGDQNAPQIPTKREDHPDDHGGWYGNALQAASCGSHETTIKLLLERGADINVQGGSYGTTLQAVSFMGDKTIVELLLGWGANVDVQGGHFGNALQAASFGGDRDIVDLLLEHGADVNAQSIGEYGTALYAAIDRKHVHIVKTLLEAGANIKAPGMTHATTLQAASAIGCKDIVVLLLDRGADINAQVAGRHYVNALEAASYAGSKPIVELLLQRGVDITTEGGMLALEAASEAGHEDIVNVLLEAYAAIKVAYHGNALQVASSVGHKHIISILLEKGVKMNIIEGGFGSALQAASEADHKDIVEFLLDKGADINGLCGYYGTALQAASFAGHEEIVKLLLDRGADINKQGGAFGTALQAALFEDHGVIVKLLQERGGGMDLSLDI